MRSIFYLPVEIVTALFFSASIAIGSGVAAISFTHRVGDGLRVALVAFIAAALSFGYSIWRNYRPRTGLLGRRLRRSAVGLPQRAG